VGALVAGGSGAAQLVFSHGGVAEPDRHLTPGSLLAASTRGRVCTPGYSASVRYVTAATRRQVFAAYGIAYPPPTGAYELDHLIPLELGGGNAASNLWPQPYHHSAGSADVKDHLENHLHALVCAGQLGLTAAQHAIAGDWWTAAATYNPLTVHPATRPPSTAPAPAPPAPVAPAPAPVPVAPAPPAPAPPAPPPADPGNGATALCNDGTLSYAAHHQGACSRHGGVRQFYR